MKDEVAPAEIISVFNKMVLSFISKQEQSVDVNNSIVLAWYRERDDRPWLTDKAICVAQITGGERFTHAMGLMARNPNTPKRDEWRPYLVTDINFSWLELSTKPPTLKDAFLRYPLFFTKAPQLGRERYDSFNMT